MVLQTRTQEISRKAIRDVGRTTSRPTIGLLVAETNSWWGQSLLQGVTDAAELFDVDLLCYVVSSLHDPDRQDGDAIYALVNADLLDGAIVSGNIAYTVRPETFDAYVDSLRAVIPLVGVVMAHEGVPSVLADGYSGMYDTIKHLIEVHGCRRLAFIRGPVGNFDADERYRAYTTLLEEYGIPFDPDLVDIGNFTSGRASMQTLWPRMQAISRDEGDAAAPWAVIFANDDMALQAMDVLREYGLRVPEDVIVVGFDDSTSAQNLDVPLTTVRQPTQAIGMRAMQMLLQRLRGEPVEPIVKMPAELVVRRSCGCLPEAVLQIPFEAKAETTDQPVPPFSGISAPIWEAFCASVQGQPAEGFLLLLDQALREARYTEDSLANWQPLLTEMRRHTLTHLGDPAARHRAEDLLQQARLLVGDAERRQEAYRRQLFEQRAAILEQIDLTLGTILHLEELAPALNGLFSHIGIECCFVSLYENEDPLAERARLLLEYDTYRPGETPKVGLHPEDLWFAPPRLTPRQILFEERRRNAIVMPLTLQTHQLGFVVMWGGQHWQLYTRLAQRLSDVVFRALLAREQERAQHEAETAERRAQEALRDVMVAQRRYIHGAWEGRVEPVTGYFYSDESRGVSSTAWIPQMAEAVQRGDVVFIQDLDGGQTLAAPVTLYGEEIIGVLAFKATDATPWTEDHLTLVRTIATEMALALETQRLLSDVQRRAARLLASTEISRVTTSILTLDELLPQAVDLIRERFDLYYAGIFLVDDSQRWAILRAGTGEAGRVMLARNHRLEVGGGSMIGACVAEGEARITFDTQREAQHRRNPLLPDTRSELALPLLSRGRVIGAMTIQDTQPGAFTQEDITTLQTMADQLANAIENARLLRRMEQNMRELELATGQLTRESWRSFLENYRQSFGYRYRLIDVEPATDVSSEAEAALQQQKTVTARVVSTSSVEVADGTGKTLGALSVPIRVRNEVLGVLDLRFDDAEIPAEVIVLVEQVATRLGAALESARLLEESRRTATREQIAAQAISGMRERLDVEAVLRNAARELRDALDLSRVSVRLAPRFASASAPGDRAGGTPVLHNGGDA